MSFSIATPLSTLIQKATTEEIKHIVELSDALEIRDHLVVDIQSSLPRIYHCELSVVEVWSKDEIATTARTIAAHKISYISFHAHSCYQKSHVVDGLFVPEGHRMSDTEMLAHAAENMRRLRRYIPNDTRISVENNNYFNNGAYEIVTSPEFLGRLVNDASIDLLLDIGHAEISAKHSGAALSEYLHRLPLEKVSQIHVSGVTRGVESYLDSHEELRDVEWQQFDEIRARCPHLVYVTIEYYRDPTVLISMLQKLHTFRV